MDLFVPWGSPLYFTFLVILFISRAADFLSTWIATPALLLEGNPIARRLGWRWGILVNIAVSGALAVWPFAAVTVTTTSLLVAARNLQSAWLMRTLGEEDYRDWYVHHIRQAPFLLYATCLLGQVLFIGAVGVALVFFPGNSTIALAIGSGIIAYAMAIFVFTSIAYLRIRRAMRIKA